MSDDRVVELYCPECRCNCVIAAVRLSDCQVLLKCAECGDVTGTQGFMSRNLLKKLHAGNSPEQRAASN